MPPRRHLTKLSVFDKKEILLRFRERNIKEIHAWNLWSYLIRNPGATWNDVPGLPKAAVSVLEADFVDNTLKLIRTQVSSDQETTKLLLQLQDGKLIETVLMRYDTRGTIPSDALELEVNGGLRTTVCLSSQIGCKMGCKFCATGTMGFDGNLTGGEIIEQLLVSSKFGSFRNVVFMGMGEPLDNYENVRDAVQLISHSKCFGLARHRITISTVGVHSKFRLLAEELPGISLALSLHAPTQDLRQEIVPSARLFSLEALLKALEEYQVLTRQRVFIEYVLLAGVNDSIGHAHQVGQILSGKDVTLNLIPFNPVYAAGIAFSAPSEQTVRYFQQIIVNVYDILCTVRQEKGQDISGACGQLATVPDLEDMAQKI